MSIWFDDPLHLFTKDTWTQFVPLPSMSTTEALNAVVRFSVYSTLLLYAWSQDTNYLILLGTVLLLTIGFAKVYPRGTKLESYQNAETMPTPTNPFMNVLLTDIQDNPNRPDAAPVSRPDVRADIAKAFRHTHDLTMDTSDMFDQAQAMRTFHTIQSSTVPNDQDKFLAWLAKGWDAPDHSSAPLARGGKLGSEGYVSARGSMTLPSSSPSPTGRQ